MENFQNNDVKIEELALLDADNARELADAIADVLDSKKGRDIRVMRVDDKTVIAEYFVLCTGNSSTQIKALAGEVEFKIGQNAPGLGTPLRDLDLKKNLLICGIFREGRFILPDGNTTILPEDRVIVVAGQKRLNDFKDLLN